MTEMKLKESKFNQMEMSQVTVKLETMTAESRQHALEMWMKRAEDLANDNELLKKELERREVGGTIRRKK